MAMTVSHVKSNTIADWSGTVTVGNSTGGSTTMAASDMVRPSDWNSSHAIVEQTVGYFEPFIPANTNSSLSAPGVGTWYIHPFQLPMAVGSGQIAMLNADAAGFLNGAVFSAASSGSITRNQTLYHRIALYQLGTGASTTRLESKWSAECDVFASWRRTVNSTVSTSRVAITNAITLSFPAQFDASGGRTYSSTAQSGVTSTAASTAASTLANNLITGAIAYLSGSKMLMFPFATSLSAGQYWMAHMCSSTSGSTGTNYSAGTMFSTQSFVHMLQFADQAYKQLGLSVSNSTSDVEQFHGSLATTTSLPTAVVGTSDMRNFLTNHRVYWNYAQSSY